MIARPVGRRTTQGTNRSLVGQIVSRSPEVPTIRSIGLPHDHIQHTWYCILGFHNNMPRECGLVHFIILAKAPLAGGWGLLRGTILNRTYGTHKNLPGIHFAIFTNHILSYLLWSPVIAHCSTKRPDIGCWVGETHLSPPLYGQKLCAIERHIAMGCKRRGLTSHDSDRRAFQTLDP